MIEEGVSLPFISRAAGIPMDALERIIAEVPGLQRASRVLSAEELGQKAARVADRALDEAMRILDEGNDTARLRLITAVTNHPMRRMQTDTSQQLDEMRGLLDEILLGGEIIEEDDEELVTEDA